MRRPTKIVLVIGIVLAGGALAWQFRRTARDQAGKSETASSTRQNAESAAGAVFTGRIEMAEAPANPSPANAADNAPSAKDFAAHDETPRSLPPATVATGDAAVGSEQPPAQPAATSALPEFSRSFSAAESQSGSGSVGAANSSGASPSGVSPAIRDAGPDGPAVGETAEQTYTIVDGDTLAHLAQKYLGSASRAGELFAYNRDVLADPELLPIGAELRIPPDSQRQAASQQPSQTVGRQISQTVNPPAAKVPGPISEATSIANPQTATNPILPADGANQLVPVRAAAVDPMANAEPPKLISLPPTHLAAVPIDHSYVVQPGDTLWSIAQRLYGDGRRADVLQQANRDRLWNPRSLRPGMTLVVP